MKMTYAPHARRADKDTVVACGVCGFSGTHRARCRYARKHGLPRYSGWLALRSKRGWVRLMGAVGLPTGYLGTVYLVEQVYMHLGRPLRPGEAFLFAPLVLLAAIAASCILIYWASYVIRWLAEGFAEAEEKAQVEEACEQLIALSQAPAGALSAPEEAEGRVSRCD